MQKTYLFLCLLLLPLLARAEKTQFTMQSPSKTLDAKVQVTNNHLEMALFAGAEKLLTTKTLQFELDKPLVDGDWQVIQASRQCVDES